MADNDQALTQEQVDAMLAGAGGAKSAPAEAPAETPVNVSPTTMEEIRSREPTSEAVAAPGGPPSEEAAQDVPQADITQLSERVFQLEAAMQQTEQMRQQFQTLVDQLQAINCRVEIMMESLQGTVGFGAHQSFVCRSCQSRGNVAAKLNCTECGEENMWGWWPPQQP